MQMLSRPNNVLPNDDEPHCRPYASECECKHRFAKHASSASTSEMSVGCVSAWRASVATRQGLAYFRHPMKWIRVGLRIGIATPQTPARKEGNHGLARRIDVSNSKTAAGRSTNA